MRDINEELNQIISKYHLDQYYPHYRNMIDAQKVLRDIVQEIQQNKKKAIFVGYDKSGIAFIRNISRDYMDIHFLIYNRNDKVLEDLELTDWNVYDEVYLISYYGAEYVERWFRLHHIRYEWIYDIFERQGFYLQREFFAFGKEDLYQLIETNELSVHTRHGWTESLLCELYCQQSKYNSAKNRTTRRIALEKCLFLTIYLKDFVKTHEYISILTQEDIKFKYLWEELQTLLDDVRMAVRERTQKDIILYWLDAIPYGDERNMPYLQRYKEAGIEFENAHTYITNTNPTLRAMFLGQKDIDNRAYLITQITRKNSPVIRNLEEQGYHIRILSGYFSDKFPYEYLSEHFYIDWYHPCSMILWDMISDMLVQETKTLYLTHALDAHAPYLNSNINDANYRDRRERYRLARLKVDEQLEFYDSFISKDVRRIFMSDHGQADVVQLYKGYHVLFNIYSNGLRPRKIKDFFTLLDFDKVLRQILVGNEIREAEFTREYVEIGRMDRYSRRQIEKIMRDQKGISTTCFGYTGIIDKEYIYMRFKTGKEWLQKRENMPQCNPLMVYDCAADVCEPKMLSKYRLLAGGYFKEIDEDEQFKYVRYLYDVHDNILKHNDMKRRADIINGMLTEYPESSIGIRLGGYHSAMVYYILSEENRKRIWGFIDNSEECLCSKLHLPIIGSESIEKLREAGIQAVLLSSYINLDALRREADEWYGELTVLDMYECLNKNGIRCKDNFWVIEGTADDYDVGFPFE